MVDLKTTATFRANLRRAAIAEGIRTSDSHDVVNLLDDVETLQTKVLELQAYANVLDGHLEDRDRLAVELKAARAAIGVAYALCEEQYPTYDKRVVDALEAGLEGADPTLEAVRAAREEHVMECGYTVHQLTRERDEARLRVTSLEDELRRIAGILGTL